MLPEVGEQNDNGENEKRGKKRRIERSRRGRRVTERKRGHAGQIAALCDLSENSRQKCPAMRPLAVMQPTVKNVPGLRQNAGQSYSRVVLTRMGVKAKITGGRAFSVVEALVSRERIVESLGRSVQLYRITAQSSRRGPSLGMVTSAAHHALTLLSP